MDVSGVFDKLRSLAACIDRQEVAVRRARDDPLSLLHHDAEQTLRQLHSDVRQLTDTAADGMRQLTSGKAELARLTDDAAGFVHQTRASTDELVERLREYGYQPPKESTEACAVQVPQAAAVTADSADPPQTDVIDSASADDEQSQAAIERAAINAADPSCDDKECEDDTSNVSYMLNIHALSRLDVTPHVPAAIRQRATSTTVREGSAGQLQQVGCEEVSPGLVVRRYSSVASTNTNSGSTRVLRDYVGLGATPEDDGIDSSPTGHRAMSGASSRAENVTPPTPSVSQYTKQMMARLKLTDAVSSSCELKDARAATVVRSSAAPSAALPTRVLTTINGGDTPPMPEISDYSRKMLNLR